MAVFGIFDNRASWFSYSINDWTCLYIYKTQQLTMPSRTKIQGSLQYHHTVYAHTLYMGACDGPESRIATAESIRDMTLCDLQQRNTEGY